MLNIRTILFPTDFSRCSQQAFAHALFLAERHEARVHLLHAAILHEEDSADPEHHFPRDREILGTLFEIADSKLASLVELHKDHPVTLEEYCARGFSAPELILEHADEHQVDLIVMGTHGRRGPSRLLLGSVVAEVVRSARVPVLTLRELDLGRPLEAIERILVPIDFSGHSRAALRHATEFARDFHAELQLVHVVQQATYPYFYAPVPVVTPIELVQGVRERGLVALEELVAEVGDPRIHHQLEVVNGHPGTQIVAFASKHNSDLVVTATHGLTGFERLLLGSTSEYVVRNASIPVFLVKPFGKSLVCDLETAETALTYSGGAADRE